MKKKTVSLMLAGLLFASMSLPVSAASVSANDPSIKQEVTTEGNIKYVDTTVYSVTLPTSNCFNFTVDPLGILSATDTTNYSLEKYPAGTAGYIVATEGSGAYIKNESSVPIKLMVDAYVTSDDTDYKTASSVNLLSLAENAAGLTNSGIDNNMMLSFDITADTADGSILAGEAGIKTETVVPYVIAIEKNGKADPATEIGTQISFALDSAAYKFVDNAGTITYVRDTASAQAGDAVGLRLSGFVNTNADWSSYIGASAEKIIVKTVFEFDKLGTDYLLAARDGRAHGVLADIDATYFAGVTYDDTTGLPAVPTAPIAGAMDYVVGQGALQIPFNLGTGTKELTVKSVDLGAGALDEADYQVHNGVITVKITETTFDATAKAALTTGTALPITITTSDDIATVVTVTIYGTVAP